METVKIAIYALSTVYIFVKIASDDGLSKYDSIILALLYAFFGLEWVLESFIK